MWRKQREKKNGADRDRTDDLYVANVPLSQLSYCPTSKTASDPQGSPAVLWPGNNKHLCAEVKIILAPGALHLRYFLPARRSLAKVSFLRVLRSCV